MPTGACLPSVLRPHFLLRRGLCVHCSVLTRMSAIIIGLHYVRYNVAILMYKSLANGHMLVAFAGVCWSCG